MTTPGHFEVTRTDHGYHARIVNAVGECVWVTEVHPRRDDAVAAITFLRDTLVAHGDTLSVQYHDHRTPDPDRPSEGFAHGTIHRAPPSTDTIPGGAPTQ